MTHPSCGRAISPGLRAGHPTRHSRASGVVPLVIVGISLALGCRSDPCRATHAGVSPSAVAPPPSVATSASAAPIANPAAASAPTPIANQDPEDSAEASDEPDEPDDGQGVVRDLGPKKRGGRCLLRIGPSDSSLRGAVLDWIQKRETIAARDTLDLCSSERPSGDGASAFACLARKRRPNVLVVGCYTFPNVMGNANPYRAHAVFDTTGGVPKRLLVSDMFTNKSAVCDVVGAALAARGPQLHERTAAQWADRCRTSAGSPVADETVSVGGPNVTFDTSYEFWVWGNAQGPVQVPAKDLRRALTPPLRRARGVNRKGRGGHRVGPRANGYFLGFGPGFGAGPRHLPFSLRSSRPSACASP